MQNKNVDSDTVNVELSQRTLVLLRSDVQAQRVAESYLFVGSNNAVLRAAAIKLAQALNCLGGAPSDQEPGLFLEEAPAAPAQVDLSCGACAACRQIASNVHPDVFILDFESQALLLGLKEEESLRQKELRIDAVRALLARSVQSPVQARKRVFIIDGAENLNAESANALLKALEESSQNSHWILLSCAVERVLLTIQSRCRRVLCTGLLSVPAQKTDFDLDLIEQSIDFLNYKKAPADVFGLVGKILADKKKSANQRKIAETFLRQLALALSARLHQQPSLVAAEKLQNTLEAQNDLARNANAQLTLETLFLT